MFPAVQADAGGSRTEGFRPDPSYNTVGNETNPQTPARGLMDKGEEKCLVRKLRRLDERAWAQFCSVYSGPLLRLIQSYFGCGREMAEEGVQMTYLRCVRSIRTFDPSRGSLFQWLITVARNEMHTIFRAERKTCPTVSLSSLPEHIKERILNGLDTAPLPDEVLARKDLQVFVQETFMELNSRFCRALLLKYVDCLKVSEIAVRMALSEKAVESLLSRSRAAFRAAFLEKLERT